MSERAFWLSLWMGVMAFVFALVFLTSGYGIHAPILRDCPAPVSEKESKNE